MIPTDPTRRASSRNCAADRCRRTAAATCVWADGLRLRLCRPHLGAARRLYGDSVYIVNP